MSKTPPGTWDLITTVGREGKHNLLGMDHLEFLLFFFFKEPYTFEQQMEFPPTHD